MKQTLNAGYLGDFKVEKYSKICLAISSSTYQHYMRIVTFIKV